MSSTANPTSFSLAAAPHTTQGAKRKPVRGVKTTTQEQPKKKTSASSQPRKSTSSKPGKGEAAEGGHAHLRAARRIERLGEHFAGGELPTQSRQRDQQTQARYAQEHKHPCGRARGDGDSRAVSVVKREHA